MPPQIDWLAATDFLSRLGKNGNTRIRGFLPTGHPAKAKDPGRKAALSLDTATAWQEQGRGVYYVVNNGGDTDSQITSCNALFCEWDDRPVAWQITAWKELKLPEPSFIILTGGKSAHLYWVFETPISVELWRDLQARLLEYADADRTLKNPSRVMRLAGAWHLGPDGTPNGQTTLLHDSKERYTADQFDLLLPSTETVQQQDTAHRFRVPTALTQTRTFEQIQDALQHIPAAVPNHKQYPFYRNLLWGLIRACEEVGAGVDDAVRLMKAHSPLFAEVDQVAASSFSHVNSGTFWYWAQHHGCKLTNAPQQPQEDRSAHTDGKQPQNATEADVELLSYSDLLDRILQAIRDGDQDTEMLGKAELKNRFRISDDRINTDLFKRYGDAKIEKVNAVHDGVVMTDVDQLDYLMEGWIQRGDICLTYGSYATGKTTLAIWKAYNYAKGRNILDRSAPCTPGKTLFIATDSGIAPLKKQMGKLGIDPDDDPLFTPGGPDQMIWIWGYAPKQGHAAWICDIHSIIRLESFIQKHGISYIVIDSAKSVSSAAGWSYTSNESVKALLKLLREGISAPYGVCIDILSHDGTEKGSHSGAKAWAEDPSMVCRLTPVYDDTSFDGGQSSERKRVGVKAEFLKDRAGERRTLSYDLTDDGLVLLKGQEVVGNCAEAILKILWEAHERDVDSVAKVDLTGECMRRFSCTFKTVENTLTRIAGTGKGNNPTPVIRKGRGRYALSPREIQRRQLSLSNRTLSDGGGEVKRSIAAQEVCPPPMHTPDGGFGGLPNPHGGNVRGDANPSDTNASASSPSYGGERGVPTDPPSPAPLWDPIDLDDLPF